METNVRITDAIAPKVWGPDVWKSINCIAFGYPNNPTQEHKIGYKLFFESLANVLPCESCRTSYKKFITEQNSKVKLDMNVMENRNTLTKWLYDLHEKVNDKLNITYYTSYSDFVKKYEAYRVVCSENNENKNCEIPAKVKINCFNTAYEIKSHLVIKMEIAIAFNHYAMERGVKYNVINENFYKDKNMFAQRNKLCDKLLKVFRCSGTLGIEKHGKYKGLPTKDELKLMRLLTSSCSWEDLCFSISLLNKGEKKYKILCTRK
jgi:hypothetical protein